MKTYLGQHNIFFDYGNNKIYSQGIADVYIEPYDEETKDE